MKLPARALSARSAQETSWRDLGTRSLKETSWQDLDTSFLKELIWQDLSQVKTSQFYTLSVLPFDLHVVQKCYIRSCAMAILHHVLSFDRYYVRKGRARSRTIAISHHVLPFDFDCVRRVAPEDAKVALRQNKSDSDVQKVTRGLCEHMSEFSWNIARAPRKMNMETIKN